jgi:dTDP-4-amino-4,6-dideoxygalactose transaminase
VWDQPGFNFRFTDILAAIGLEQMKQLSSRIEKVKKIYKQYSEGLVDLSQIKIIPVDVAAGEVPVYVEAVSSRRNELINFLSMRGIQCRPFYPNLNEASYFNDQSYYARSEHFANNGLYLPAGPEQSLDNIPIVISAVRDFFKSM